MAYQDLIPYKNMLQDTKQAGGPEKYVRKIYSKAYADGFVKGRNQELRRGSASDMRKQPLPVFLFWG